MSARQVMIADQGSGISTMLYPVDENTTYIKNFADYNVSTMTLVVLLEGQVRDLDALQYVVPVVGLYRTKYAAPGEITSFRWRDKVRGESGGQFKNSPIVDICVPIPGKESKKISTKISLQKIQMCGCKSMGIGSIVGNFIIDHINSALIFLRSIQTNKMLYIDSAEWLLDNCKGENGSIEWPKEDQVPSEYDYFVRQIMYRCDDMTTWSQILDMTDFFQTLPASRVGSDTLISKVGKSMVNYNYQTGFRINREQLLQTLLNLGYHSDYMNCNRSSVTLEMYSDLDNDDDVIRNDGMKRSKQTVLIQLSGSIMHSGPGGKASEDCYYKFAQIIDSLREVIEKTD
jgi:hypothetical protein